MKKEKRSRKLVIKHGINDQLWHARDYCYQCFYTTASSSGKASSLWKFPFQKSQNESNRMYLNGMGVAGLPENFKECRIWDEKESRKQQTLLFQVAGERLLADLELFEQVRKQLRQCVVSGAAVDDARNLVRSLHYALPRLVNVRKPLRLLSSTAQKYCVANLTRR